MSVSVKERVIEWFTSAESCFLLGAGCSLCAGKPLIGELTTRVLAVLDEKVNTQFSGLKCSACRPPTIEDLINYLIKYQSILRTVSDPTKHYLQPDWIDIVLNNIKKQIVTQIVDPWLDSDIHARFLERLSCTWSASVRDIFTLNYDTILEATLDKLKINYIDGFRGSRRGWFDPTCYNDNISNTPCFRIYKLHGSINWVRDPSGHVRRIVVNSASDINEPVVVYPSEQKYIQTQYGVYETLIGHFRERLRNQSVNNKLIILGYSFNDDHINEAIIDAILAERSNLTVIAFVGPDVDHGKQELRLHEMYNRSDERFNVYVGDLFSFGSALDEIETRELLSENLWKFENLVTYVAGGLL